MSFTRLILAALACVALWGMAAAQWPHTHRHGFGEAERWSKILDDPERDAWQKPHEVIQALALKPDAVVADLGTGTGYFTVRLAHMLPKGRVYAIDTEGSMLKHVAERTMRAGLKNVVLVLASPEDPRIPDDVDLVLLVDVYHHIERRQRYFASIRRTLKPGSRLVVIDFRLESPHGPPRGVRVVPERVKTELKRAGFGLVQEHTFLPYQYFLVFEPLRP